MLETPHDLHPRNNLLHSLDTTLASDLTALQARIEWFPTHETDGLLAMLKTVGACLNWIRHRGVGHVHDANRMAEIGQKIATDIIRFNAPEIPVAARGGEILGRDAIDFAFGKIRWIAIVHCRKWNRVNPDEPPLAFADLKGSDAYLRETRARLGSCMASPVRHGRLVKDVRRIFARFDEITLRTAAELNTP